MLRLLVGPRPIALVVCLLVIARSASSQEQNGDAGSVNPLTVTSSFGPTQWIRADSAIRLTLSRTLATSEGRLAIVIGATDITALFDRSGTTLRYRARTMPLPAGASELAVYRVAAGKWTELARLPIKVLTPAGFSLASLEPSVSLTNKGQLAEGHTGLQPPPTPATYQDFGFSGGVRSTHARGALSFRSQSNFVGVSRRQEALRWGLQQERAPKIDLSDYQLLLQRGTTTISLGHITDGGNRHLMNGFASRGVQVRAGGDMASVALSALSGSSVVGWDNLTGLDRADHRVQSGTLNLELMPSRPGALHVDASLVHGSLLPQTSYTQGGVVDAERSTGSGVQVSAATPAQRFRVTAGFSRSRFENPALDRELLGDTTVVAVKPEQRAASYVELNAALLQSFRIPGLFTTSLNAAYKRERVDPMFRSVVASTQADRLQDTYELIGSVGAVALQASTSRNHDNLDDLPSLLRTFNRISTAQVSVPVASLFRVGKGAAFWPVFTYGLNSVHQFGAGVPENSGFSASHVPDQVSDVHNGTAAWQVGRWRLQYRVNQSTQDNRQTGREKADFISVVNAVSIDVSARANIDLGFEASAEHQTSRETAQTNRVRRAGGTATWRPTPLTTFTAFLSDNATRNDPITTDGDNWEMRFELARAVDIWRHPAAGGTRGQLFLRYANTSGVLWSFPTPALLSRDPRGAWTLTSGVSLRLY
jgi:hypothetical protein